MIDYIPINCTTIQKFTYMSRRCVMYLSKVIPLMEQYTPTIIESVMTQLPVIINIDNDDIAYADNTLNGYYISTNIKHKFIEMIPLLYTDKTDLNVILYINDILNNILSCIKHIFTTVINCINSMQTSTTIDDTVINTIDIASIKSVVIPQIEQIFDRLCTYDVLFGKIYWLFNMNTVDIMRQYHKIVNELYWMIIKLIHYESIGSKHIFIHKSIHNPHINVTHILQTMTDYSKLIGFEDDITSDTDSDNDDNVAVDNDDINNININDNGSINLH